MRLSALRDAYLSRAVARLRASATTVGLEQLLGSWLADLRFSLSGAARRAAAADLAACADGHDYFRFTRAHLPGALFFPPGASQIESEILSVLAFAAQRSPRTVVEIGTQTGGTTFLLGTLMPSVTRLVGIDLRVRNQGRLRAFARPGLELRFISASSMAESTYRQLEAALGGAPVDLREYRRLVAPGGLIAFHDIVPDNELRSGAESLAWAGEVPVLWELLRSQYRSHEFVESWEQEARGIGVLEYDPAIDTQLAPHRAAADRSGSE